MHPKAKATQATIRARVLSSIRRATAPLTLNSLELLNPELSGRDLRLAVVELVQRNRIVVGPTPPSMSYRSHHHG
jgi:hypothetical protein